MQLLLGGVPVLERRADQFRTDLKEALIGDGRHGFIIQAPSEVLLSDAGLSIAMVGGDSLEKDAIDDLSEKIRSTLQKCLWKSTVAQVGVNEASTGVDLALTAPKGFTGQLRATVDGVLVWSALVSSKQVDNNAFQIFIPGQLRTGESVKFELEVHAYGEKHVLLQEDLVFQPYVQAVTGWVDGVFAGTLRGWAWDASDPSKSATVSVYVDDRFLARTKADIYRLDLEQLEIRGGLAGFELQLPRQFWDDCHHTVRVEIGEGARAILPSQPFKIAREKGTDPRVYLDQARLPDPKYSASSTEGNVISLTTKIGRLIESSTDAFNLKHQLHSRKPVDIIIPVFNAPAHLQRCLASLSRNTTYPHRLIIIDDASDVEGMASIFNAAIDGGAKVLHNAKNLGFTSSVNLGLEHTDGDVVLLNSDTEVGPRWLEQLVWAGYSNPSVGTVSAVSPNAGAFSIPAIYESNDVVRGLTNDDHAVLLGRSLTGGSMNTPTGHGFCMFIRRALIDEIGMLDATSFPRGYGEENDFCMRALQAGYQNVVQSRVVVGHAKGASFLEEREQLMSDGQQALKRLHPDYLALTSVFRGPSRLADARTAASEVAKWAGRESNVELALEATKPRVLIALHDATEGGTALTTEDLVSGLEQDFNCFLLMTDNAAVVLSEWKSGWKEVARWDLRANIDYLDAPRPDYEVIVTNLLVDFDISLLHVRHLIGHHSVLMQTAKALNIPVVWSLHDFYQICPSVSLVDAEGQYCRGICTQGESDCKSFVKLPAEYGRLRGGYIVNWQKRTEKISRYADAVITTSESIKQTMMNSVPSLNEGGKFHVIEHGRNLSSSGTAARRPKPTEPIRVLMLGNLLPEYKGFKIAQAIRELDVMGEIEFHFLGSAPGSAAQVGIVHGRYHRSEVVERIAEIAPSVVGIWSTWPETYCHTLSEAWLAGVPVIGSQLGAVGERLQQHGGGWIVNCDDPADVFVTLKRLRLNGDDWDVQSAKASAGNLRSAEEMASDYRILYKSLINSASLVGTASPIVQAVVCQAGSAQLWGQPQARLRSILQHSAARKFIDVLNTSTAEIKAFGSPTLSVPARRLVIDCAEGDPSGVTSEAIICQVDKVPFVNERPWQAAAFVPSEIDIVSKSPKVIALVSERDKLMDESIHEGIESLENAGFLVRIVSPSELPTCDTALQYAAQLRQALMGVSMVIPITCDKFAISDEVNLLELGLMAIPILWDPEIYEQLLLPSGLAYFGGSLTWAASVQAAFADPALVESAESVAIWLAERWGLVARTKELVVIMNELSV